MTERRDAVEPAFAEWLEGDGHRAIEAPLGAEAELLRLDLNAEDGEAPAAITLHGDVRIEPGPNGLPALVFGEESSAELPPLDLDTDTPFSLALWIRMARGRGQLQPSPARATRTTPTAAGRSRSGARELYFRLRGDRAGPGRGATSISINPNQHAAADSRRVDAHRVHPRRLPASAAGCTSTATATGSPNRAASSSRRSRAAFAPTGPSTSAATTGERRAAPSTSPAGASPTCASSTASSRSKRRGSCRSGAPSAPPQAKCRRT